LFGRVQDSNELLHQENCSLLFDPNDSKLHHHQGGLAFSSTNHFQPFEALPASFKSTICTPLRLHFSLPCIRHQQAREVAAPFPGSAFVFSTLLDLQLFLFCNNINRFTSLLGTLA